MATFSDLVADALTRVPQASCDDLSKADPDKIRILDVREPDETQSGVLFNAVLLPRGLLEQFAPEHLPKKDQPVYVYDSTTPRRARRRWWIRCARRSTATSRCSPRRTSRSSTPSRRTPTPTT